MTTRRNYFRDMFDISRGALRKFRQEEWEKEQKLEEAAALRVTREQLKALQRPFASVKVEFSDLDGKKWTKSILRTRSQQAHLNVLRKRSSTAGSLPPQPTDGGFVVLSKDDLESFSPEETIRASGRRRPSIFGSPVFERPPSSLDTSPSSTTSSDRDDAYSRGSVFSLFPEHSPDDSGKVESAEDDLQVSSPPGIPAVDLEDDFLWSLEPLCLAEIPDEEDDDDDELFLSLDDFPFAVTVEELAQYE